MRENDPANPNKPLNAAQAYVVVDPSQAERLTEQWVSSTNRDLFTAGNRLKAALVRWEAWQRINEAAAPNDGPATTLGNSKILVSPSKPFSYQKLATNSRLILVVTTNFWRHI